MVVAHSVARPHLVSYSALGRLPPELQDKISNVRELYGIDQAICLLAHLTLVRGLHVQIRTDNTSAMYYVSHVLRQQGGWTLINPVDTNFLALGHLPKTRGTHLGGTSAGFREHCSQYSQPASLVFGRLGSLAKSFREIAKEVSFQTNN